MDDLGEQEARENDQSVGRSRLSLGLAQPLPPASDEVSRARVSCRPIYKIKTIRKESASNLFVKNKI